jgi:hypothetical protein
MSTLAELHIKQNLILGEWRVSPALAELEEEWEHAACCAEAHCPGDHRPAEPQPYDPDEWWPESCVA